MVDGVKELPTLDVRTLAAFEHCHNAGRITYLRQGDDDEPIYDRIANLSYTPSFDYARLLEQEATYRFRVIFWAVIISSELLFVWYLFSLGHWFYGLCLFPVLAPSLYFATFDVHWYACVLQQILAYRKARPKLLPEKSQHPIPIDWWSLVKSGLSPEKTRHYDYVEIGLSGKPWRLLVDKESRHRIPVIRHTARFGNEVAVTPGYRLHLAACALLVEYQESAEVHWGVVVDSETLLGFAVPISEGDKERAKERCQEYRQIVPASHQFSFEKPPTNACRYCPLAYPRSGSRPTQLGQSVVKTHAYDLQEIIPKLTNEQLIKELPELHGADHASSTYLLGEFRLWIADSRKRALRHSDCGDVFQWEPIHVYWESRFVKAYRAFKSVFHR